jgi:hypothetical protein
MSVYLKMAILCAYFSYIREESQAMILMIMQDRILRHHKVSLIGFLILNVEDGLSCVRFAIQAAAQA